MRAYDERGASAVEYGLLVALIASMIVGAVLIFGGFTQGMFVDACDKMLTDGVSLGVPSAECD